jgi:hypothetical protein
MAAQAQPQLEQIAIAPEPERWSLALRIAFRFCSVYFGLYCLTNQIVSGILPFVSIPDPSAFQPVRGMVLWTATHVFHITKTLVYQGSGSGDKTFDWVLDFCLLIIAVMATVVWSALDRRRANYQTDWRWFNLSMRFALGSQMLAYGCTETSLRWECCGRPSARRRRMKSSQDRAKRSAGFYYFSRAQHS